MVQRIKRKAVFLIFQIMFCATTATIVSGTMAERTQFRAYFVYCIFISALVCGLILFGNIRSAIGLRIDRRIEEDGLDYYEHNETSYNI